MSRAACVLRAQTESVAMRVPVVGTSRESSQHAKWCAWWDRRGDSIVEMTSRIEVVQAREASVETTANNAQAHSLTQFFAEAQHDARGATARSIERRHASVFGTHIPGRHAQARTQTAGLASAYSPSRTAIAEQSLADEQRRFVDVIETMSPERQALVRRVRTQVLNGGYDTQSKLDVAMDRAIDGAIDDMLEHFDRNSAL